MNPKSIATLKYCVNKLDFNETKVVKWIWPNQDIVCCSSYAVESYPDNQTVAE